MESVKQALQRIPGVFLNEDYRYSIRAFVFDHGRTVPLLTPVIRNLLAGLQVERLALHQTYMDTTITAKEADKGQGLLALLSLIGKPEMECIGIGDTEPDLPMFRVAARSFAPAHIPCRRTAEVLGCRVASKAYQPGLLEIARSIVHADGSRCESCRGAEQLLKDRKNLFLDLLKLADKPRWSLLMRALLDPMSVQTFRSNTSAWRQR
jgi:hypothetical protein